MSNTIPFLTDEEYAQNGFRCGLEIHQQLATSHKLFCNCPVGLVGREPDMRIMRHMRPTLSELGEYDRTALMEFKTRKDVVYELFSDRTCTYEMDDTPPFPLNREALDIAIEIALLLNCKLVDEVHVTRKQYLDGSIPTGFQRTAMVGLDGWVPFKGRKIRIAALTLEEDSCREVSDKGHTITWKTDRLGTPLVEVITQPDILSPREVPEVNRLIGDIMRATGKVRRGIGTVRQDVNVSVNGGTRIEIKGVPKLGWHAALTHVEAGRQQALINLAQVLKKRGVTVDNVYMSDADVTGTLQNTRSPFLGKVMKEGGVIHAVSFRNCKGVFNTEVQPDVTFADEVSGRVRVIACIDNQPNILHSDEPGITGMRNREWEAVKATLGAGEKDLKVLLFGEPRDVKTAVNEVIDRMKEAVEGVPPETRQPFADGSTGFERILPGPDRMYPDTDTPPAAVTPKLVEAIRKKLPMHPWEREKKYRNEGLSAETAVQLSRSDARFIFDAVHENTALDSRKVAHLLLRMEADYPEENLFKELAHETWVEIFSLWERGTIGSAAVHSLALACYDSPEKSPAEHVRREGLSRAGERDVRKVLEETVQKLPGQFKADTGDSLQRFLFGEVRRQLSDRVDASLVIRMMEQVLQSLDN